MHKQAEHDVEDAPATESLGDAEIDRLARELADLTGESPEKALLVALQERLGLEAAKRGLQTNQSGWNRSPTVPEID